MLVKKLLKLNNEGSIGVGLPRKVSRQLNWSADDFVTITVTDDTVNIKKLSM